MFTFSSPTAHTHPVASQTVDLALDPTTADQEPHVDTTFLISNMVSSLVRTLYYQKHMKQGPGVLNSAGTRLEFRMFVLQHVVNPKKCKA